jgi:hypothetical protein
LIAGSLVVLLVAALVLRQLSNNKAASSFNAIAKSAGCSQVRTTSESGAGDHLKPGERTTYDIDPPTHGKHAPTTLAAGVYDKPLSTDPSAIPNIYQSVHSLEHGAIIVWYDGLAKDDVRTLDSKYRSEEKVIVVPYPKLGGKTHVAMTAWGRMVTCGEPSTKVIDAFIKRFREARSAPEPLNRI